MKPRQQKITLSATREPVGKPMLSQSYVRHVKSGVSIEELAEDEARSKIAPAERFERRTPFARRTLLSSITVRPVLDETGAETGMYAIPAGAWQVRALELLECSRPMNRTAPVAHLA